MAWEISITAKGWSEIYEKCHATDKETLCKALGDYHYEVFHGYFGHPSDIHHKGYWNWKKWMRLTQDVLADEVFRCIEEVNTCDAGGYRYWIDPEGYHGITLED